MKLQRACRAVYAALLHLYPSPFRKRFGPEMIQAFDARYRTVVQSAGAVGRVRFGAQTLIDLLSTAAKESLDTLHPTPLAPVANVQNVQYGTGLPAFQVLATDAPQASLLAAGALISVALFGFISVAMENWRSPHWRSYAPAIAREPRFPVNRGASSLATGIMAVPTLSWLFAADPSEIAANLVDQLNRADVLALGEFHGTMEDSELRLSLIRDPRFALKARYIVVEFANAHHQVTLDRYIEGSAVPASEIEKVWRDITTPGGADSPVYSMFLAEVRSLNQKLPADRKLRVLAADPPIDWSQIKSRDDWRRIASTRDAFAADLLARTVLDKGHKALLICGAGHVWRNASGGPIPADSTLVPLLDAKYPGRIYSVIPVVAVGDPCPSETADPNDLIAKPLHMPFPLFPPGTKLAAVANLSVCRAQAPDLIVAPEPGAEASSAYVAETARRRQLIAPPRR